MKLVPIDASDAERLERDEGPQRGSWYWVISRDDDGKPTRELWCATEIGSNYVEFQRPTIYGASSLRVHLDQFPDYCTLDVNPDAYLNGKIAHHQENVRRLLDEARQLAAGLGVTPRDAIASESEQGSSALAVASGTADIKAHKKALLRAKDKTLPDIFKQVEKEHEQLARWMKAKLLPMQAELTLQRQSINAIDQRIFTVELYAGLVEELTQIKKGAPAPNDTKIALFQRRHYMDEECLANYQAGGMEFKDLRAFDRWLVKPENLSRILPHARCCVAFMVRRNRKERSGVTLSDWIRILEADKLDKLTFLYIRNGEQVFRLSTEIDFEEQLFPDKDRSTLLGGGEIYHRHGDDVISQRKYDAKVLAHEAKLAEWHALSEEQRKGRIGWERLEPDSVYYDDVMRRIQREATKHNRIAVVLQGLLDRSPAFAPHPPWRLWTAEGFALGIELIYDDSHALTSGDEIDFEAYRAQLNESIRVGSMTIGQEEAWEAAEAEKYNDRLSRYGRESSRERYRPHGNPGPGEVAEVKAISRRGMLRYEWTREYKTERSWRRADPPIPTSFQCAKSDVFNVSAYTPGDFKLFYADPRTRAKYLEWAPFLLAAEDWHAVKKEGK